MQCPVGGDCSGELVGLHPTVGDIVTQQDIAAQSGFWTPPASDGLTFYRCLVPGSCLAGTNDSKAVCAPGYGYTGIVRSVLLWGYPAYSTQHDIWWRALMHVRCMCCCRRRRPACGVCLPGFFEQFGKCVACPASNGASFGALFGIAVLLVVVAVLLFLMRTLLPVDVLKLGLSMLQVSATGHVVCHVSMARLDNSLVFAPMIVAHWILLCLARKAGVGVSVCGFLYV